MCIFFFLEDAAGGFFKDAASKEVGEGLPFFFFLDDESSKEVGGVKLRTLFLLRAGVRTPREALPEEWNGEAGVSEQY